MKLRDARLDSVVRPAQGSTRCGLPAPLKLLSQPSRGGRVGTHLTAPRQSRDGFVERFAIIFVVDTTCSQDLLQRWPFHFVMIRDGDDLSGEADKNNVLSVLPARKSKFPLEHLPMPLSARERQV